MDLVAWLTKNAEWVFSGVGAVVLSAFFGGFKMFAKKSQVKDVSAGVPHITISNTQSVGASVSEISTTTSSSRSKTKAEVTILFVDDDVKFKVVNILKTNGWTNTKIISDVTSLEQPEVAAAEVLFIDIQGVGNRLMFRDQGLGLVVALHRKYPEKKLVIYSAEIADPFHAAFKVADEQLSKDADPYEFMETIDRLTRK